MRCVELSLDSLDKLIDCAVHGFQLASTHTHTACARSLSYSMSLVSILILSFVDSLALPCVIVAGCIVKFTSETSNTTGEIRIVIA